MHSEMPRDISTHANTHNTPIFLSLNLFTNTNKWKKKRVENSGNPVNSTKLSMQTALSPPLDILREIVRVCVFTYACVPRIFVVVSKSICNRIEDVGQNYFTCGSFRQIRTLARVAVMFWTAGLKSTVHGWIHELRKLRFFKKLKL